MSRMVKPLTDAAIRRLKPKDKEYIKSDGRGLFIRVFPHGVKTWYFSYKFNGALRRVSFGGYPALSLAYAREKAREYRSLVLRGIDPILYYKELAEKINKDMNILQLAEMWRDKRLEQGRLKASTILDSFRRVEIHILPVLGKMNIREASIKNVMPVLLPLKGSNTLYKINIALNQIFQLAEDEELIEKNPFRKIHNHFYYSEAKNQPTISPEQLPNFFKILMGANINRPTALLIEWQLLTILRPAEAVSVEWADVDFINQSLHIPAERMKGGRRSHDVPLSKQALAILEQMQVYNANRKHIFASYTAPYNKPMSSQAANVALKRMGFKGLLVSHGLRSIASTYLHELDLFSAEAVELCLSHQNKGKVRAAYDKSRKWKSRKNIMQVWGDYVEQCKIKAISSN